VTLKRFARSGVKTVCHFMQTLLRQGLRCGEPALDILGGIEAGVVGKLDPDEVRRPHRPEP